MKVFLLKDVEKVGMAGEIIEVTDGFGANFLIPKKLALAVTDQNVQQMRNKLKTVENRKEVIATKSSLLSERISTLELTIKRKMHDGGKLYGAINQMEIVDLLAHKGISVAKNQVEMDKAIKTKGIYSVKIKLSSKLQPSFMLKVVEEPA